MDATRERETGASEVIGAVLLVSLVVIGGAVVAAFAFGQQTPKEVPHVMFGVSLDSENELLTLHHTGGETLHPGEYGVTWYDTNGTLYYAPEENISVTWAPDGDLQISEVDKRVGDVVLSYKDGAGGETVLRRVPFEDFNPAPVAIPSGPWTISGYKRNVTSSGQLIGPLKDVTIRLTKTQGEIDFPADGMVDVTDDDGYFSFSVPEHQATYRLAEEEINPTLWKPYSPASGQYDSITLTHHQTSVVRNFSNERLPPPPWKISGHKWNVTWKGENPEPLEGITINLTLVSGDAPGFPPQGRTATTNEYGYYEFEVPGYWEFEVPATLPTYRLTEEIDRDIWRPYAPASGVREVTLSASPGATDEDFSNWKIPPNKKIYGYKTGYSPTGWYLGPVEGIRIDLTHTSGEFPDAQIGRTITNYTDENGYYEFVVSGFPAEYTVKETDLPEYWTPWDPESGSFENVPPGARRDFKNMRVPMGGKVIRLEKTEQINTATEGYLVGGSYFQVDTTGKDHVTINGSTYKFKNNDEVRFVINGDQNRGRMTVTKGGTDLVEFSFNVTMQKRVGGNWVDVEGASGLISDISITNINKNGIVTESTLTYRHPSYESWTMLRLDGETVIPSVVDQTPFEFTNLHIVHDNSQHEGNNIMWIWLEPGNNSLLVEGDYVNYPEISPSSDP